METLSEEDFNSWSVDYLKTGRALFGFTQKSLAQELGVTPNTVARWERGLMPISRMAFLAIKATFESQDELIDPEYPELSDDSRIDSIRLRQLLQLCHPDKHNNSKVANEVTAWLIELRKAQRR